MDFSADTRRSTLVLRLITVVLWAFCVDQNIVSAGQCSGAWNQYMCLAGNGRRSLSDDVPQPLAEFEEWKRNMDKRDQFEREVMLGKAGDNGLEDFDAVSRQRSKYPEVSSVLKSLDGTSHDEASLKRTATKLRSGPDDVIIPWFSAARRRGISGAPSARKRSSTSNEDVYLDAAVDKLKELIAKKRLLKKWLKEIESGKDF